MKDQVKNTIIKTFNDRFSELSPQIQAHYMTRLYRVTGDEDIKKWVIENIPVKIQRIEGILEVASKGKVLEYSLERLSKLKVLKENDILKKKVMGEHPKVYFHDDLLAALAYLKGINVDISKYLTDDVVEGIKSNVEDLIDPQVIKCVTVRAINGVYWTRDLIGVDKTEELINNFKSVFAGTLSKALFSNRIYGYTHIVISSSSYYLRFVEDESLRWIHDELVSNIDRIIYDCSADIVAEVGLTLKLMKTDREDILKRLEDKVLEYFDPAQGLIPYNEEKPLSTLEHRNIIAVMFLTDFDKLHLF